MKLCVALVALVACGGKREERTPVATPPAPTPVAIQEAGATTTCEQLPFAESTPVPEASGAAWLDINGKLSLVVVADSGHNGGFGIVDPESGATGVQGKLPLGKGAGDDIEGLAARGQRMFGVTSSGFMREWEWQNGAFVLVAGPYPISAKAEMMCDASKTNCGKNYEGLAIPPAPIAGCELVACSKEDGRAYCFATHGGLLEVTRSFELVDRKDILADCTFADTGAFFAGNNLFGLARVLRIDDVSRVADTQVIDMGPLGTGFPETIAVRGDIVYRMSDMGGTGPSLMLKFRCPVAGG